MENACIDFMRLVRGPILPASRRTNKPPDLEAVLWLEQYLTSSFKGTLVVVSHDRHFLNEVVTDVVHFQLPLNCVSMIREVYLLPPLVLLFFCFFFDVRSVREESWKNLNSIFHVDPSMILLESNCHVF